MLAMSSRRNQRNLVKREVRKQVDRTVASQFSLFSEIFGKRIRQEMFDKDRAKLRKIIENQIDNAFDTFEADWSTLSPKEQRKKLSLFLDKTFGRFARVPRGKHALAWYRRQTEEALTLRGNSDFAASYDRYSKATGWLVRGLFETERISVAQDFFSRFAKSEEGFSLAQLLAQQVLPGYSSLDRLQAKPLETRDIHRLAKLYLTYSGVFEKLARMQVALNRIRKLDDPDYESQAKRSMGQLEQEILKEPRLRVLLRGFDRHVRNSIAHPSYRIHVSAKRVTFRDRRTVITMTWNRFREATIGLSVLVFAILVTGFLHYLLRLLIFLQKVIFPSLRKKSRQ